MPALTSVVLRCDFKECEERASTTAALSTDGKLVVFGSLPEGWKAGENPREAMRMLYTLCPRHAQEQTDLQAELEAIVKEYAQQPVTLDSIDDVKAKIAKKLDDLCAQGLLPKVEMTDIRLETDGSISLAINDSRGAVKPDSM